jgi:hypothetical protein
MAKGWASKEAFKDRVRQFASKLGVNIRVLTVRLQDLRYQALNGRRLRSAALFVVFSLSAVGCGALRSRRVALATLH